MSIASKTTSSLQAYNMLVFRHALHPEFFQIEGRKRLEYGEYELESWVFRGGHAIRFQHNGSCVSEVVIDRLDGMPDKGLVTTLPCAGERDHEADITDRITFVTSIQTETLSDHLYMGTYNEMVQHGRSGDCLICIWAEGRGRHNLSLLDAQRYNDEVHVQSYHLRSDCGLVLRTQSIFQLRDPKAPRRKIVATDREVEPAIE